MAFFCLAVSILCDFILTAGPCASAVLPRNTARPSAATAHLVILARLLSNMGKLLSSLRCALVLVIGPQRTMVRWGIGAEGVVRVVVQPGIKHDRGVAGIVRPSPPGALVVDRSEPGLPHRLSGSDPRAEVVRDAVPGVAERAIADRLMEPLEDAAGADPVAPPVGDPAGVHLRHRG